MTVIKIDNTLQSFYNEITRLKNEYPNLAFISYIDGEYGFRVVLYNCLAYDFAIKQRELKNPIVGLCFIGNTFFLKHYCDIIIEVQDIAFEWESFDASTPEELARRNHFPIDKPYSGSNGIHPYYKTGYFNYAYENILTNLQFTNIFFTYHCASSWHTSGEIDRIQTSIDITDLDLGKINNVYYKICDPSILKQIKNIDNVEQTHISMFKIKSFNGFIKEKKKNDNIVTWIRKTNNTPTRNLPPEIYWALFIYCITNKKHLHIFLDLEKVSIPKNEYLHVYDNRKNNQPLFDEFIQKCNNSYIYVGSCSGSSWMAAFYSKANCIIHNTIWWAGMTSFPQNPTFNTKEELIGILDSMYIN